MQHVRTSTSLGQLRAACLATALIALPAPAAPSGDAAYTVVDRWMPGGAGGWDYLTIDAPRHRLFITRGDRVEVLDSESGKVIGGIANTAGVHGVALAPDLKRGYTSNGRANSVTEFDYDTLAVLREVPVPGANPDAILYEPLHHHLFTFNGRSKDATVFDARTLTVITTLPMPDKPEFAADGRHGRVYVNIESEQGQIVAIDTAKLALAATWPLPGCTRPTGLAIDSANGRLFSVCSSNVMTVTDAKTGRQVARVAIGDAPDAAAFDAAHGFVFSSNGDGTLTVIRQDSADAYSVAATLATQRGARTMALDPATRRIYLVTAEFGPPPPPTPEHPKPRPEPRPDSFVVLVAAPGVVGPRS
ncbi:MAG TPA: YncE family protein [Steroidobacteraceae bacterium]|nr:YncE family protein [Steroidobacteraceae bacterium]